MRLIQRVLVERIQGPIDGRMREGMVRRFPSAKRRDDGATGGDIGSPRVSLERGTCGFLRPRNKVGGERSQARSSGMCTLDELIQRMDAGQVRVGRSHGDRAVACLLPFGHLASAAAVASDRVHAGA